jgi:hypothetical protein
MIKPMMLGFGIATLLTGCASTPPPTLPNAYYDNFIQGLVAADRCGLSGQVTPDASLWEKRRLTHNLNTWTYDRAYFESRFQAAVLTLPAPPVAVCNQVAMEAAEYKQTVQENNAAVEANARAWNQVQYTQPVHTYCNKIGAQTLCNSY